MSLWTFFWPLVRTFLHRACGSFCLFAAAAFLTAGLCAWLLFTLPHAFLTDFVLDRVTVAAPAKLGQFLNQRRCAISHFVAFCVFCIMLAPGYFLGPSTLGTSIATARALPPGAQCRYLVSLMGEFCSTALVLLSRMLTSISESVWLLYWSGLWFVVFLTRKA